jgi:hypothetical protein
MRPVLIDTNAYCSYKRNDKNIRLIIEQAEIIGISPIVLGELHAGWGEYTKTKSRRVKQIS